jgi:hypothetical protein
MRNLKRFENYIKENLELETKDDEINPEGLVSDNSFEEDDQVPEEEEYDYVGNKLMNDLAKKLGTKINFYSETEKFHIGKRKFDTLEDVLKYLKTEVEPELEEMPMESLRYRRTMRNKRTK